MENYKKIKIFKATNTLDSYLTDLNFTSEKEKAEVILVGGKTFNLNEFPNLKAVFKTGVGIDNLPIVLAQKRNIIIQLPSENTRNIIYEETADFTCGLILTGIYKERGNWSTWNKENRIKTSNLKLLIVGNGNIGKIVNKKMSAFMQVMLHEKNEGHTLEDLKQKIKLADIITIHLPLNDSTNQLFDKELFNIMRDKTLIVNTSRANIIDEVELFTELQSGRIRAALDVFWEEPYHGMLTQINSNNLTLTPHIASSCEDFLSETASDFIKLLKLIDND